MYFVGSRLRDDRKQCAARAAISCREALGRKCKLLDALHREVLEDTPYGVVLVIATIDRDVEISSRRTAHRECAHAGFGRIEGWSESRAWYQGSERGE